jgi:thioredoxin reductase
LTSALWLGRYRRKTLVFDAGGQRNLSSAGAHGYFTRDGISPQELLDAAKKDLRRYDSVQIVDQQVDEIARAGEMFRLRSGDREVRTCRVLLATGVEDEFPQLPGLQELYGKSIFHCSCCDGYESSGQSVAAIGWNEHVAGFALDLLDWGATVHLLTNGDEFRGDSSVRQVLENHGIQLIEDPVEECIADDGELKAMRLASGRTVECTRAFFSIGHKPRTELARNLGCQLDDQGYVTTDEHGLTSVDGVYAAGDITPGEQLIQTAAAEGAVAGIACAMSLRGEYPPPRVPPRGPDPEQELEV